MFNHLKAKTYSDKKWNEDAFSCGDDYLVVIDGATGLGKNNVMCEDDAMWFANQVKDEIESHIKENQSLSKIVEQALVNVQKKYALPMDEVAKIDMPSACIACFRERNHHIEFFGLGDTCGVVEFEDGTCEVISDAHLERLDKEGLDQMVQLSKTKKIPFFETRPLVNDALIINRKKRNTENGYYSLDLTTLSIPHACIKEWDKKKIKRIACMSDGFYQIMSYTIYSSISDLLDAIVKDENQVFEQLKAAQEADKDALLVPRFKFRDDMTMAYAEVE